MENENGKQYAVVTRVTPVREGGRTIVHTYGPYTYNRAHSVSSKLKRQAVRERFAERAEVSICVLQDPESWAADVVVAP